ncbi:hypothetical protein GUITHDRAFT_139835 [Guillardia theta CCMP2712]|uniref:VWFA domain-containing protein n=3 Tax=Guillardia theta TaxID=55529 RepID=L1J8A1_GUITC|nr:hypothetical protein GUITHDRAFT_139835 [Guillardia theta CCMP2712]EKX44285.1 hypothetical protein GUITHDRAFT_139835 [Guillardia theta CCMP2712]|eukprot:XP_005831265.1 hypothetical protein GUITHDRAFT_139835 [Guillardia theta CCMP2712]
MSHDEGGQPGEEGPREQEELDDREDLQEQNSLTHQDGESDDSFQEYVDEFAGKLSNLLNDPNHCLYDDWTSPACVRHALIMLGFSLDDDHIRNVLLSCCESSMADTMNMFDEVFRPFMQRVEDAENSFVWRDLRVHAVYSDSEVDSDSQQESQVYPLSLVEPSRGLIWSKFETYFRRDVVLEHLQDIVELVAIESMTVSRSFGDGEASMEEERFASEIELEEKVESLAEVERKWELLAKGGEDSLMEIGRLLVSCGFHSYMPSYHEMRRSGLRLAASAVRDIHGGLCQTASKLFFLRDKLPLSRNFSFYPQPRSVVDAKTKECYWSDGDEIEGLHQIFSSSSRNKLGRWVFNGNEVRCVFDPAQFKDLKDVLVSYEIMAEELHAVKEGFLPMYSEWRRYQFESVGGAILTCHGGMHEVCRSLRLKGPWERTQEVRRRARRRERVSTRNWFDILHAVYELVDESEDPTLMPSLKTLKEEGYREISAALSNRSMLAAFPGRRQLHSHAPSGRELAAKHLRLRIKEEESSRMQDDFFSVDFNVIRQTALFADTDFLRHTIAMIAQDSNQSAVEDDSVNTTLFIPSYRELYERNFFHLAEHIRRRKGGMLSLIDLWDRRSNAARGSVTSRHRQERNLVQPSVTKQPTSQDNELASAVQAGLLSLDDVSRLEQERQGGRGASEEEQTLRLPYVFKVLDAGPRRRRRADEEMGTWRLSWYLEETWVVIRAIEDLSFELRTLDRLPTYAEMRDHGWGDLADHILRTRHRSDCPRSGSFDDVDYARESCYCVQLMLTDKLRLLAVNEQMSLAKEGVVTEQEVLESSNMQKVQQKLEQMAKVQLELKSLNRDYMPVDYVTANRRHHFVSETQEHLQELIKKLEADKNGLVNICDFVHITNWDETWIKTLSKYKLSMKRTLRLLGYEPHGDYSFSYVKQQVSKLDLEAALLRGQNLDPSWWATQLESSKQTVLKEDAKALAISALAPRLRGMSHVANLATPFSWREFLLEIFFKVDSRGVGRISSRDVHYGLRQVGVSVSQFEAEKMVEACGPVHGLVDSASFLRVVLSDLKPRLQQLSSSQHPRESNRVQLASGLDLWSFAIEKLWTLEQNGRGMNSGVLPDIIRMQKQAIPLDIPVKIPLVHHLVTSSQPSHSVTDKIEVVFCLDGTEVLSSSSWNSTRKLILDCLLRMGIQSTGNVRCGFVQSHDFLSITHAINIELDEVRNAMKECDVKDLVRTCYTGDNLDFEVFQNYQRSLRYRGQLKFSFQRHTGEFASPLASSFREGLQLMFEHDRTMVHFDNPASTHKIVLVSCCESIFSGGVGTSLLTEMTRCKGLGIELYIATLPCDARREEEIRQIVSSPSSSHFFTLSHSDVASDDVGLNEWDALVRNVEELVDGTDRMRHCPSLIGLKRMGMREVANKIQRLSSMLDVRYREDRSLVIPQFESGLELISQELGLLAPTTKFAYGGDGREGGGDAGSDFRREGEERSHVAGHGKGYEQEKEMSSVATRRRRDLQEMEMAVECGLLPAEVLKKEKTLEFTAEDLEVDEILRAKGSKEEPRQEEDSSKPARRKKDVKRAEDEGKGGGAEVAKTRIAIAPLDIKSTPIFSKPNSALSRHRAIPRSNTGCLPASQGCRSYNGALFLASNAAELVFQQGLRSESYVERQSLSLEAIHKIMRLMAGRPDKTHMMRLGEDEGWQLLSRQSDPFDVRSWSCHDVARLIDKMRGRLMGPVDVYRRLAIVNKVDGKKMLQLSEV